MTLRKIIISCDWPGCGNQATLPYYAGALRDYDWAFQPLLSAQCSGSACGTHLCPEHRFKPWAEVQAAIEASLRGE